VAVKVIAWPTAAGFGDDVRVVVVDAIIFWLKLAEVLPVLFASPLYLAVMV
jgi:hypothetical protein